MWRVQLGQTIGIWSLVLILNLVGMITQSWGTQLYIMLIENFILAILFICLGIYEHKRMIYYWEVSEKLLSKEKSISRKLLKKKLTLKLTTEGVKEYPTRFDFLFM